MFWRSSSWGGLVWRKCGEPDVHVMIRDKNISNPEQQGCWYLFFITTLLNTSTLFNCSFTLRQNESHTQRMECYRYLALGYPWRWSLWYLSRPIRRNLSHLQIPRWRLFSTWVLIISYVNEMTNILTLYTMQYSTWKMRTFISYGEINPTLPIKDTDSFSLQHCLLTWIQQESSKGLCPMCRQSMFPSPSRHWPHGPLY